ncbi:MAG: hypothetical protein CMP09_15965 [Yangia sp.]|nr:hypothetical protein [Salipiger sp.]
MLIWIDREMAWLAPHEGRLGRPSTCCAFSSWQGSSRRPERWPETRRISEGKISTPFSVV